MNIKTVDLKLIAWLQRAFLPLARVALFVVFFYFGLLKLLGESPASELARALAGQTIGLSHFDLAFTLLALLECAIGILILFPRLTRVVVPLLFVHMAVVCSPLLLLPGQAFSAPLVPTLEGQYIIKNVVVIALAIGIAAQTRPLAAAKPHR
jgi:uncharacterized membrane protein YkgB